MLSCTVLRACNPEPKKPRDKPEEELDVDHSRGDLFHNVRNEVKLIPRTIGLWGTYTNRKNELC